MTASREVRRICATYSPQEAVAAFERRGIDVHDLDELLYSLTGEPQRRRSEVVELLDARGRLSETALYLPHRTAPSPLGVIVGLHGVGGSGVELEPHLRELADACGAVLLCPTAKRPAGGNSNFDLAGIFGSRFTEARWTSELGDFPMRALRWARENLEVDVDRCAIIGTSMGGIATWNIAATRWDVLSMASPINGAPSIWELFGPDRTMRALLPNLLNLPLTVIHGGRDKQIPPILDQEAVEQLRHLGHRRISFIEVPDGEHRLSTMKLAPGSWQFEVVVRCFRSSRRDPWPLRVLHRTRDCESGRAHWVAAESIIPGRTGYVDAQVSSRSRIDVRAVNTSSLRLYLSDRLVDPGVVLVVVNGDAHEINFTPSMVDMVTTYVDSGADPGHMAQMVVEIEIPEICE